MNPNENSDSKLISQIDRRIQTNQPTGIPLVDDLAAAIPQPRPDFQQQLEDRLAAHYHLPQNAKGELELVTSTPVLDNRPQKKWAFIPLTLAAAMLAVIIIGSIILSLNRGGSQPGLAVVLQGTATQLPPTPVPLINVVVALQDLPNGYQFPTTLDELAGVVGYFPWPETALFPGTLREDENGLEKLLGQELSSDVFREQPLISNRFVGGLGENIGIIRNFLPADDKVAITLPINLAEIAYHNINSGDQIDIIASIPYTNVDEYLQQIPPSDDIIIPQPSPSDATCTSEQPCLVTQALIHQATVLRLGDFTQTADVPLDIATVAVSPQEAAILTWLLGAKIPYILRPASPDPLQLPSHPGVIPTSMWLSEIPIEQIQSVAYNTQQGDLVDVTFSFLWQEVEPEMSNTSIPENGRVFKVTILHGVKIYKLGESIGGDKNDIVTLLLTQEDMALLSSLLKITVPFAITLTQSNRDDLFLPNRSDSHFIVEIPISRLTGAEGLLEAPNTVNILAQVDFNGYDPGDPNAFALEGKNSVAQVVARNAGVVDYDADFLRIAVVPEDLPNLQWALKAGIPLTLQLPE